MRDAIACQAPLGPDQVRGVDTLFIENAVSVTVPPQARVPAPHFHRNVDEAVYGLAGTLTTSVDGKVQLVRPGDIVFIPRGRTHLHENLQSEIARVLVVLTPGRSASATSRRSRPR